MHTMVFGCANDADVVSGLGESTKEERNSDVDLNNGSVKQPYRKAN